MDKWYEIREIQGVYTYGYKVSETRKEFGVFVMPYDINTFICRTREEAERWIRNKEAQK